MPIRLLPPTLVNRIAAGEVVERPASAVKELVENALDACASHIVVKVVDGGQALITVTDDGSGMEAGELLMAVERHATSKIPNNDLTQVTSLGFRGEALPSIGAVARLTLTSRCRGTDSAWRLSVTAGRRGGVIPTSHPPGTSVEVRDLFFATPARLNFLKGPRAEAWHIRNVLERLALAHPMVSFTLSNDGHSVLYVQAAADLDQNRRIARISRLLGRAFVNNAVPVSAEHDGIALGGLISLPPFVKKPTTASQYLFVNGRPVRDRLLGTAVRAASQDILSNHNILACLFLTMAPDKVDINVHPAKAEVRFRNAEAVRTLLTTAVRHALAEAGHRKCTTVLSESLEQDYSEENCKMRYSLPRRRYMEDCTGGEDSGHTMASLGREEPLSEQPLAWAQARAQIHSTYIIAETSDGMIIVDQHAAKEHLILERLLATCKNPTAQQQRLLSVPEVVNFTHKNYVKKLVSRAAELSALGLVIESFGQEAVIVRAIPALLGEINVEGLIQTLCDGLAGWDVILDLQERLYHVCTLIASFYGRSMRSSGCCLTVVEMNALLQQMNVTLHTAQFSCRRPPYIEWKLKDIKKLFHRC